MAGIEAYRMFGSIGTAAIFSIMRAADAVGGAKLRHHRLWPQL
jgi:hypothetical protein